VKESGLWRQEVERRRAEWVVQVTAQATEEAAKRTELERRHREALQKMQQLETALRRILEDCSKDGAFDEPEPPPARPHSPPPFRKRPSPETPWHAEAKRPKVQVACRCKCGRQFCNGEAIAQHLRDSSRCPYSDKSRQGG